MPLRCVLIFDVQHTAFNLTAESRVGRDVDGRENETTAGWNGERGKWWLGEKGEDGKQNPLPQLAMHLDRAHDP